MDTALPQKFPFILDRNLAKANCTGNRFCTSCDTVVLGYFKKFLLQKDHRVGYVHGEGVWNFRLLSDTAALATVLVII